MLAPATLAALPSTRAIPDRDVFYVARPARSILTSHFLPPRGFQFGAHRRETDLGRHETRVAVGDGHPLPAFF